MKERLKQIISEKSFLYNEKHPFKLVSGNTSPYYFDLKKTTFDPEGSHLIGELIFDIVDNWKLDGVGGLILGACPISAVLVFTAWKYNQKINQFVIRKELKDHGSVKWIEGNVQKGDRVVIVDDVITTGSSVITSIKRAEDFGLDVCGCVVVLDRREFNGINNIRKVLTNKPVVSMTTRYDILEIAKI